MENTNMKIVPFYHVVKWTGLSRSQIYRKMSQGIFPKNYPISDGIVPNNIVIGKHKIGWFEKDILEWIHEKWKNERLIKLPRLKELTCLSTSAIYRYVKKGTFPKPVPSPIKNGRNLGWVDKEIYGWLRTKINRIDALCSKKSVPELNTIR